MRNQLKNIPTSSKTRKTRQHLVVTVLIRMGVHEMGLVELKTVFIKLKKFTYVFKKGNSVKTGTATTNNRSETKIIKMVPLCQHTCEASNQHLRKKMLT